MIKKVILYMKVIMPILFISIGLFYIVNPNKNLDVTTSRMLGAMIILYGLFRGYRALKDLKQEGGSND